MSLDLKNKVIVDANNSFLVENVGQANVNVRMTLVLAGVTTVAVMPLAVARQVARAMQNVVGLMDQDIAGT
jgi:hypothetical protein